VVRDDTDNFIGNVVYNVLLANERGEHYELPPELTEDEQLQVAILVSTEEEKCAFPRLEDALTLSVAPPPPPGPPPMAAWPWPQGPFIDLSGKDEDEDGQA
jgi:hypothetical protein